MEKPRLRGWGWDARSVFQISELTTVLLFELHLLKKTEAPISTNSQNRFGGRIQLTRLEGGVPYSNPGGPLLKVGIWDLATWPPLNITGL